MNHMKDKKSKAKRTVSGVITVEMTYIICRAKKDEITDQTECLDCRTGEKNTQKAVAGRGERQHRK